MQLLKPSEYMAATGLMVNQALTCRSGLGPHKAHGMRNSESTSSLRANRTSSFDLNGARDQK